MSHAHRLIAEGRMAPAGLAAFEARREDRTAIYAFERPEQALEPGEQAALAGHPAAAAFWAAATPSYRRTVTHWVVSAKRPETRARRLAQLIDDCAHGRLVPSRRYGDPPAWLARAAQAARETVNGEDAEAPDTSSMSETRDP